MPPKTKGRNTPKEPNENINNKNEVKASYKTRKTRRALADKTNSDDNSTMTKNNSKLSKAARKLETKGEVNNNNDRPRRDRRLPPRFTENHVLKNLPNCIISPEKNVKKNKKIPKNTNSSIISANSTKSIALKKGSVKVVKLKTPIKKTPQKTSAINQNLILKPRPKRICHLPLKFEDHSVSPSKFIPVQPCFASTPIVNESTAKKNKETVKKSITNAKCVSSKMHVNEDTSPIKSIKATRRTSKTTTSANKRNNATANNVHVISNRITKARNLNTQSPTKKIQKCKERKIPITNNRMSYRLLDGNMKDINDKADVYEFTYDPNEESPPQKKKRKRPVTKRKQTKPKILVYKNNYDVNVAKTIQDLKEIVTQKAQHSVNELTKNNTEIKTKGTNKATSEKNYQQIMTENKTVINNRNNLIKPSSCAMTTEMEIVPKNDDIPEFDHHDNLTNYSPVNSPYRATSPILNSPCNTSVRTDKLLPRQNGDPLNLQEEESFFDDIPIASSSINTSVRHPHASPWRVDFQNLPLKWHPNAYVKPNMTPAIESSFINNFDEPKKKHVYTNIVPILNEPLPELHQVEEPSKFLQSSIISYIKEVSEKSANKKKRERSATPNIYDLISSEPGFKQKTPKKLVTPVKGTNYEAVTPKKNASVEFDSNSSVDSNEKAHLKENRKRKSDNEENISISKTPRKEKDANNTFFGFDDSENQENISPAKKVDQRVRELRPRARAVLQEINNQNGPMRAVLPVKSKSAPSSENVNNLYEEFRSAADAPMLQDKQLLNVNSNINQDSDDDSNSVHLFEDIDVVHHLKPTRKSYGKSKKVAFKRDSRSDDDVSSYPEQEQTSSGEEDLSDLTFVVPSTKSRKTNKKKQDKKKKISKKEEAEAEAWAANFNSMCEDVEKCPLVVE